MGVIGCQINMFVLQGHILGCGYDFCSSDIVKQVDQAFGEIAASMLDDDGWWGSGVLVLQDLH